jgi:hypothetical protein
MMLICPAATPKKNVSMASSNLLHRLLAPVPADVPLAIVEWHRTSEKRKTRELRRQILRLQKQQSQSWQHRYVIGEKVKQLPFATVANIRAPAPGHLRHAVKLAKG